MMKLNMGILVKLETSRRWREGKNYWKQPERQAGMPYCPPLSGGIKKWERMCDCLNKVEHAMKNNLPNKLDISMNVLFDMKGNTYPEISYQYHRKKRDGKPEKKVSTGNIIPTYCPFCGKKYPAVGG